MKVIIITLVTLYILSELAAYWLDPEAVRNDTDEGRGLRAGCFLAPVFLVMLVLSALQWLLLRGMDWTLNMLLLPFGMRVKPRNDNPMDYIL